MLLLCFLDCIGKASQGLEFRKTILSRRGSQLAKVSRIEGLRGASRNGIRVQDVKDNRRSRRTGSTDLWLDAGRVQAVPQLAEAGCFSLTHVLNAASVSKAPADAGT